MILETITCVSVAACAASIFSATSALAKAEAAERQMRVARRWAESIHVIASERKYTIEVLRRDLSFVQCERDTARQQLDARVATRSAAISKGNRTRALRRRGTLLPATDFEPAQAA